MKIKYLKVMHNANPGDVKEVTDFEANILIKTGVAEKADDMPELEYLKNLNGTPVVDDFGSLVQANANPDPAPQPQEQKVVKPRAPRKPKAK